MLIDIINEKNDIELFFDKLKTRGNVNSGDFSQVVKDIINDVINNGDEALVKYTTKFDNPNFKIEDIEVSQEELKDAYDSIDSKIRDVLNRAYQRIYDFHYHDKINSWQYTDSIGATLGMKITPLERVGIYVPGGKAFYPSSVLMNAIPAIVAGVKDIVMVTPAINGHVDKLVLACAYICKVSHVYKIGGAQAVAALAYGTKSVLKVDKIVGPGNIFVALAKREVYGICGIDSIAGPSEITIIGNETSNSKFLACDLLGQAEHDELASSTLFITDYNKALEVQKYVEEIASSASRKHILEKSLKNYSKIIIVDNIEEAIKYVNRQAPEHLEVAIDNATDYLDSIKNAGAIFLGHYSAEAIGDYMAGTNHVLPTVSTARFFSPLGVYDFIKRSSIINLSKDACLKLNDDVSYFAECENLTMHALSSKVRGE